MRIFFISILFLFLLSCKSQPSSVVDGCDNKYLFDDRSVSAKDSFFIYLARSGYNQAKQYLIKQKRFDFDSLNRPLPNNSNQTREDIYLLYRFEEFAGGENSRELMNALLKAYQVDSKDSAKDCLNYLLEAEFDYLSFYSKKDSVNQLDKLDKIRKRVSEFPNSLRIKYLYAKLSLSFGRYKEACLVFNELLRLRYYEKPITDMLFFYYLGNKISNDSIKYYTSLFSQIFPDKCNIGIVLYESDTTKWYKEICEKCVRGEMTSDSIIGRVGLLKSSLKRREFRSVEDLYSIYREKNPKLNVDELKIWERGEYFDSYLRSLFLQKKYKEMYLFALKDLGYNKKINIESGSDFRLLIQQYYNEYIKGDGFSKFFSKEFPFVKEDLTA